MENCVVPAERNARSDAVIYSEYAECEIGAELESVRVAVEKLRRYCLRFGLDPAHWPALELAAVEGLNNAIEHGCASVPDGRVQMRLTWEEGTIEARIIDPGTYLPDDDAIDLPEDPLDEGGRGAFLMQTLMDSVEHRIEDGRHVLILRKKVGEKVEPTVGQGPEAAAVLQSMVEDLSTSYEHINALFRFAELLATTASFGEFLDRAMPRLLELVGGSEVYLRVASAQKYSLDLIYPPNPTGPYKALASIPTAADTTESGVFQSGRPSVVEYCARLAPHAPLRRPEGGAAVCPVTFQNNPLGVLTVLCTGRNPSFNAAQVKLVTVVAEFIGIARTTATLQARRQEQQRLKRELEIAAEIQQMLLPRSFPELPHTRIFGVSTASREVGGDYFDVIPVEGNGVLVAIADVMGKGMPAALLATILRAAIRARLHLAAMPGFLLTETNRQIKEDLAQLDMFITAQVVYFSFTEDTMATATAGHCPILMSSSGGKSLVQIDEGGVPLGVLDDYKYGTTITPCPPGSRILLLTDGLYEVQSPQGRMLGLEGLQAQIIQLANSSPSVLCARLLEYVRTFSGEAHAADDRTLVAVERF